MDPDFIYNGLSIIYNAIIFYGLYDDNNEKIRYTYNNYLL